MYSPCTPQINQHLQWPLHIGSSPNRILPFLKGVTSIVETPQTWIWGATFFLNIFFKQILYMLNQIYIHYINTLFVLESFIISCWLLKGKKIGIGIGIGQFAQKKSVSESATKNHDRCITNFVIVHKQSNHKRLRALHNTWFGCLAWMLLLLVYSHHLWKNWISFLKHPIIQSNAIRREINTSGLSSQTKHICLLLWDSNETVVTMATEWHN